MIHLTTLIGTCCYSLWFAVYKLSNGAFNPPTQCSTINYMKIILRIYGYTIKPPVYAYIAVV